MSEPNGTDPPLPYLLSAEPERADTPRNDWGRSIDEVPVFAEPQRFINLPAQTGIIRSYFREGVMRCDERGLHFSGRENTPKRWLTEVSGITRIIIFAICVINSLARVHIGRKGLASLVLGVAICVFPLAHLTANFINGRFRNDATFFVGWDAVRGLQLDKKLRFLTLVYKMPTPYGVGSAQHHLTFNRLQPATVAAFAETVERFAPLATQNKYAAQERYFKNQRNMLILVCVLFVIAGGLIVANVTGLISP